MNDHDAEDQAGEDGEEPGDACKDKKKVSETWVKSIIIKPLYKCVENAIHTEHVLGAELPEVFELHVDVDDGRAPGDR